jgi:hypothetical protein
MQSSWITRKLTMKDLSGFSFSTVILRGPTEKTNIWL